MAKTYRYRDLSYACKDDDRINLTVEFISDGNEGNTSINIPGPLDPEDIENAGTRFIGTGKELRGDTTVSFSAIMNRVPEENEIRIKYKINDKEMVEHAKPKSEDKDQNIVLFIKFPQA